MCESSRARKAAQKEEVRDNRRLNERKFLPDWRGVGVGIKVVTESIMLARNAKKGTAHLLV